VAHHLLQRAHRHALRGYPRAERVAQIVVADVAHAGAIAKQSRRGWRIDRPNPRVEIDGITALLMALDRLENRPVPAELIGWI
jgi:hypothetical protein